MSNIVELAEQIAPTGRLRVAINTGNPILAADGPNGEPVGVSVDLAEGLAKRLGLATEHRVFKTARESVEAVQKGDVDIGFFAVDPARSQGVSFTEPYLMIEGAYLVRDDSPLQENGEVDRQGTRVAVGNGSAYDLFLTRHLEEASILRAPTSPGVVDFFVENDLDVAAGVKQQLEFDAARLGGLRLLPGNFMNICQAMGVNAARGEQAAQFVRDYIREALESGAVLASVEQNRVAGVRIPA
ncbi:transporter substrate-binding domain-containing protein [Agrobacterium larrymoorei]|uniref:Transporter substrate-binding domain-containing protein n=1 Tax=Agrobacterium larrymoorei TaxID=160699 RepID=A0AAF0HG00_9HYPH|nr:transporter substrate-binding domain-containing protein [Agrobacterium larrymoorei]WHA44016.1 transporter substrate-binding domain-containing protein [Agrobacterium larrymoorei]